MRDLRVSMYPLLASISLLSLSAVEAQPKPGELGTGWLASVDAGFKEARRTKKPLLVMFRCVP